MAPMAADAPTLARRLFFDAPRTLSIQPADLGPLPDDGCLVRTLVSAVSAGSELLFYRGDFPDGLPLDATLPALQQEMRYPLRYGYAAVGRVERTGPTVDPALLGRTVFAFEPHATAFVAPAHTLHPLPDGLTPEAAALLPSMETAVTLTLDGAPLLGESVVVFGAGVVGLLTTALLARFPLAALTVVDPLPARRAHALRLGATHALAPNDPLPAQADLVYELSGNPAALNDAIAAAGFEARVVVGSWYGRKQAPLDLGGHFHRSRIRLIASQVSTLGAAWAARWSKARRIEVAWSLLRRLDVAPLISHRIPFTRAADAYTLLDTDPHETLQVLLTYDQEA